MLCLGQYRAATISIMDTGPKWSSSTGTNILMVLKQNGWSVLMQAADCAENVYKLCWDLCWANYEYFPWCDQCVHLLPVTQHGLS